jgi:hypothetical protein
MKIKMFRLTSGEDIIAEIFNELDAFYVLKNPVQIVMHPTPDGKVSVGFGQFIPYADGGKLQVAKSYIGVEADVDQNMSNEYNRIYGSGIVVANTLPPLK